MKNTSLKGSLLARILALLLILSIAVTAFAACTKDKNPPPVDTDETKADDQSTEELGPDEWTPDTDLSKLDYELATVRILQRESTKDEFFSESGVEGSTVSQAVYNRNDAVMSDLNIEFEFKTVAYSPNSTGAFGTAVRTSVNSGSEQDMYHIVANPMYYTSAYILEGLYIELGSIEDSYINTDKGYWNSGFIEEQKLDGKYYYLLGDACSTLIEMMEVVFVNNDLAEQYLYEYDLYELVYNGEWTYAKFLELIAKASNGDETGTYGFSVNPNSYNIDGFLSGMGLTILDKGNGALIPSVNVNSEHNFNIITALRDLYYENSAVSSSGGYSKFVNGQSIFTIDRAIQSNDFFAKEVKYSLLPIPKWDETQADYSITAHDEYTGLTIPSNVKDPQMITAVLESLAYHSHSTVYQAMYESTYRLRYSDNQKEADMFDFIYDHLEIKMGQIYSYVLGEAKNTPRYLLYPSSNTYIANKDDGIYSKLDPLKDTVEVSLEMFWNYLQQ